MLMWDMIQAGAVVGTMLDSNRGALYACMICGKTFPDYDEVQQHYRVDHQRQLAQPLNTHACDGGTVVETNISNDYRQQKDVSELQKESNQIGKDVDKVAAELDSLNEKAFELKEEIRQLDSAEMVMISGFDKWIVYYNDVAASRMKELQKRVGDIRKRREEALKELADIRPKISLLESRCEVLSYKQGELRWESRLQGVKERKWKGG
jgi:prefoldin subunit 5